MKQNEIAPRYEHMLRCFTHLPQQILSLHEIDDVTQYVLHSLCDQGCLNLVKAAYFVDNPDFDCLKGVAGFNKDDEVFTCDTVLDDTGYFKEHINHCVYNKKVRTIITPSSRRTGESKEKIIQRLAHLLDMNNPSCHTWNIKHDNFGILLYEQDVNNDTELHQEFLKGLSILGFCPVS